MTTKTHPVIEYDAALIDSIATSMDLRKPNREALDRVAVELADSAGQRWYGVCDLATAVGKTYLAAGLVDYLAAGGVRNFLFVVPNRTIYTKTIDNFTSGTARSLLPLMTAQPTVIHPGNFNESWVAAAVADPSLVKLFVFNIQQLIEPSRQEKHTPGRKVRDEDNENLGTSLYELLKEMDDLVVLSDEHHLYAEQAQAFNSAITDLDAMAVVGLTATPDTSQVADVIYQYPLAQAIADRLVKTPCIAGRTDNRGDTVTRLQDALVLLEAKKVAADAYAAATGGATINPVLLVVARSIADADEVADRLRQPDMFNSDDAVLVIHSQADDDDLARLAAVEDPGSTVRAIVSVQMLGVGWDVKNVYVIISLRPSVSEALTEQTLGRGLRLPWGSYTDNDMLDTVDVLAHEQYSKLLANSAKVLEGLVADGTVESKRAEQARKRAEAKRQVQEHEARKAAAASSTSAISSEDGGQESAEESSGETEPPTTATGPVIVDVEQRKKDAEDQSDSLDHNTVIEAAQEGLTLPVVTAEYTPQELHLATLNDDPFEDLGRRIASGDKIQLMRQILDVTEDAEGLHLAPRAAAQLEAAQLTFATGSVEDELRRAIIDSDLVPSSSANAGAATRIAQAVLRGAGGEDAVAADLPMVKVMVSRIIENACKDLEPTGTFTVTVEPFGKTIANYRKVSTDRFSTFKTSTAYSGWKHGLYPVVWFDSEPERGVANILDDDKDVTRWVRLQRGDTPIPWAGGIYQPDFYVQHTDGVQYLLEVKMDAALDTDLVQEKKKAGEFWANLVTAEGHGTWKYFLLPASGVKASKTFAHLRKQRRN